MPDPQDLKNAKKALDRAWRELVKHAQEVRHARRLLEQVPARDNDHLLVENLRRAELARDNWLSSVHLAQKVIEEYYKVDFD